MLPTFNQEAKIVRQYSRHNEYNLADFSDFVPLAKYHYYICVQENTGQVVVVYYDVMFPHRGREGLRVWN